MTLLNIPALQAALDVLPIRFSGPGGVAIVVHEGVEVASRVWGYASLEEHARMTRQTRLPICSISKQFTCGSILGEFGDISALDDALPGFLPNLEGQFPTVRQLCDNQSGLRDYWAMTVVEGARAEQTFAREDAVPMVAAIRSGHFQPGYGYSYCNCNYRILPELVNAVSGQSLEDLYRRHIWGPAGMHTAVLTADTRNPADSVTGYEGNDAVGFFAADNGVFWIGDAGISASLDDMLAYERWIDATREDESSIYRRISAQPFFADGTPARYGFGLAHEVISGVSVTGHGGALRGFRAHRLNARDERTSVVVLFNHEADAHGAAVALLRAALGLPEPAGAPVGSGWYGQWLCAETGLLARIEAHGDKAVLHFATGPQTLFQTGEDRLESEDTIVERDGERLRMRRLQDNLDTVMHPVPAVQVADAGDIAGEYHCAETGTTMRIEAHGGAVFALFGGRLGEGRMEPVHPAAHDVWLVRTRRAMDAPAPGDWTLQVQRALGGKVSGVMLGCWLARRIEYQKTN